MEEPPQPSAHKYYRTPAPLVWIFTSLLVFSLITGLVALSPRADLIGVDTSLTQELMF